MPDWLPYLLAVAGGYLLGSIPFGLVLTRNVGIDLRSIGSGNIGATNVLRTGRKDLALATLLLDSFKAGLAVLLFSFLFHRNVALIAGAAAFFGHCFPIWLKFNGGKRVATYAGLLVFASWKALVIGAETFSRILDWEDRTTCVLFGDGAGAVVIESREVEADGPGIIATKLHADGAHKDLLYVDGGPSTTGEVGKLRMKGREVFRHAVVNLAEVLNEVLEDASIVADDIDWVVPHQANARILDATARKLGLSPDKVVVTVDQHANTSAASVPLAFDVARKDGRIKEGDLVMFEAMGGGFTWGAALARL